MSYARAPRLSKSRCSAPLETSPTKKNENGANEQLSTRFCPRRLRSFSEASVRTTGMRHFDVQLIGGIVLHQGKIAEMRTGEGKTLVATLPSYLNALDRPRRRSRHHR